MIRKWLCIAKAEFFVLTARFKERRKLFMSFGAILGVLWATIFAPVVMGLVMDVLLPITQIHVLLQVMFPGLMRAMMLILWIFLLIIPITHALAEIKIGQWEIFLANNVKTRDILIGTFLGKVPINALYVLFLTPLLLTPFLLAFQVSFLGQLLIYATLVLMVLITIWLSNIISAAIQAKLGDSPRGNDIAKALAMVIGLIIMIPMLGLQLFAPQLSAILGLNIFLVFPFTWNADLISWLVITFNGINLTTSQIVNFQNILQLDLFMNGLLVGLFGIASIGIGLLSSDRLFTYRLGARTETIRTVSRENFLLRGLRKIVPSSFGSILVTSLKTFFRKVQNLSKIAMALTLSVMLPFLVILVYGHRYTIELSSLLPITGYALAFMGVMVFSGTTFLEGQDQLWMIKSAPGGTARFVKARLVIALLLALPLSLLPTFGLTLMTSMDPLQSFWLFMYSFSIVCGGAFLGIGITALNPNYEDMKSPAHQKNMFISMMAILIITMAGPFLVNIVLEDFIGIPLDVIMVSLGIAGEGIGQAIITTASMLIIGGLLIVLGTHKLGRPDI